MEESKIPELDAPIAPSLEEENPVKPYDLNNPYLGLVQRRISREWKSPLTDPTAETIVRFRLDRSGEITSVEIEKSSGSEYFDLAAKRAIQSASPLPAFPADLDEPYLTTHFKFSAVGRR